MIEVSDAEICVDATFGFFNEHLYNNELVDPMNTLTPDGSWKECAEDVATMGTKKQD